MTQHRPYITYIPETLSTIQKHSVKMRLASRRTTDEHTHASYAASAKCKSLLEKMIEGGETRITFVYVYDQSVCDVRACVANRDIPNVQLFAVYMIRDVRLTYSQRRRNADFFRLCPGTRCTHTHTHTHTQKNEGERGDGSPCTFRSLMPCVLGIQRRLFSRHTIVFWRM